MAGYSPILNHRALNALPGALRAPERAPVAQRRLRLLENLREEIPRRGRTADVHGLLPGRLLDETQSAAPTQIVQYKLQAFPLARRKPGHGKGEPLAAGVVHHPRALRAVRRTAQIGRASCR